MNQTSIKKNRNNKDLYIASSIIGGLIIVLVVISILTSSNEPEDVNIITEPKIEKTYTAEELDSINNQPRIERLLFLIEVYDKPEKIDQSDPSSDHALRSIADIKRAYADVRSYQPIGNDSVISLSRKVLKQLPKYHSKMLPELRKEYCNSIKNKLWREDITVICRGTTIEFIGGIFAANANKQDFVDGTHSILNDLRFKRVTFRWYEGQDEYTYYDIYKGKDSDPY